MMGNKDYLSGGCDMVCCADLPGKLCYEKLDKIKIWSKRGCPEPPPPPPPPPPPSPHKKNQICIVGLQMGILLFVLPFVCSFFFLSKFFIKDISTTVKDRNFIFGIQVHNLKLYRGIENGSSPICSSFYLFLFLSFQIFRQRYLHNHLR